jgi:CheY-like chemotaxis protein
MPQMDGLQTLRALREIEPELRVILCSATRPDQPPGGVGAANGFLGKPFDLGRLSQLLALHLPPRPTPPPHD